MGSKWRPMKSAPRGGTLVLAANTRMKEMAVVGWTADENDEDGGSWTDAGNKNCAIVISVNANYFDFWMPLPESPEALS